MNGALTKAAASAARGLEVTAACTAFLPIDILAITIYAITI